jgi:hypothetical protein
MVLFVGGFALDPDSIFGLASPPPPPFFMPPTVPLARTGSRSSSSASSSSPSSSLVLGLLVKSLGVPHHAVQQWPMLSNPPKRMITRVVTHPGMHLYRPPEAPTYVCPAPSRESRLKSAIICGSNPLFRTGML